MAENLLIVESPAKARTIKKYLGQNFDVLASYGHVRDLVPKEGAVDTAHNFALKYEIVEKNEKHLRAIAKALKKAKTLYLATDPDREGEAISWHIVESMKEEHALNSKSIFRVVFHEITKNAIQDAIIHPREISLDLVHAQQARRALDFLVGFNLSPLLWKKIRPGLSAGRVQSPALRLIVEREAEILRFEPREYWTIEADCSAKDQHFRAKLISYQGKKLSQFSITADKQAHGIENTLKEAAKGELIVVNIDKKQRKRNPAPPFITSTLQQEAARKLGFTTYRTMRVAQQLYEGIDLGTEGSLGLITYMRTDSVNLASEAITEIRELITQKYGEENIPDSPRFYQTKAKNAQEAHEAIRPTSIQYLPDDIKRHLTDEQYRLYDLIWKRTVACQMIHATIDTVAVNLAVSNTDNLFRANGSTITNPGFIKIYQEGIDDAKKEDGDEKLLPVLEKGDIIQLVKLNSLQHFTEPPPRYTEASLVKALEEYGIGRPSTYANIIYTIKNREYVVLEQKRFKPTDVGSIVNKFLTTYFSQYVDYDFTAKMEDELDAVSRGEKEWVPMLEEFWVPFKELILVTEENVKRKDVTQEEIGENCPKCHKPLTKRLGKRGTFIGCSGYPDCDYTRGLEESAAEVEKVEGAECPECHSHLVIKYGKYGKFIGCSNYPTCKHMEPIEKPADTGIDCPICHQGHLLKRKSRYGKYFYSCSTYPKCKYAVWNEPISESCPKCQWPILTIKTTKKRGTEKVCPQKECGFSEPYQE